MRFWCLVFSLFLAVPTLAATEEKMTNQMFDSNGHLHFNYNAADLAPREAAARKVLEAELAALVAIPKEQRTFANTYLAYDEIFERYGHALGSAGFLAYVSPDEELRNAALALQQEISDYMVEVATRRDIYQAFKDLNDLNLPLGSVEARMLRDAMIGFKKSGLMLDDKNLAKFKELAKKLAQNSIAFSKNVREYKDDFIAAPEQLKGLPQDYIDKLQKTDDGNFIITLNYPDYTPFMLNADDDDARRQLEFKFARRGGEENIKLLEDSLFLRGQMAKLLGYKTHAALRLDTRMAKDPKTVAAFLKDLQKKLKPMSKKEDKDFLALKEERTGAKSAPLTAWQAGYWANLHKKINYDVDQELLKEYFQADIVIDNMFEIFGSLFGLKFEPAKVPVWHKDVKTYAVKDLGEAGKTIAYIYMDLYPRDGKYKHAACFDLVAGKELPGGEYQKPFTAIVANFNPPSGDTPSLLTHGEVGTLFHEFGHVLHNALTQAKYSAVSGTAVARDFVEVPSQILENWAWHPTVLKKISKHYKTGAPLGDETIAKMIAAKNHGNGGFYLRQNFLAQIDMKYHTTNSRQDSTKEWADFKAKITEMPITPRTYPQASFDHIMGGYDAGYYGYLWAEVIAEDFFSEFQKAGIFNPEIGKKFRTQILAPGGSYDEQDLVKSFLGREVSNEPFLKSIGLQ